jgi:hypothetical protein
MTDKKIPVTDDPRRLFSELMHVLTIFVPSNTGVLDEFIEEVRRLAIERSIPKATATLMLDILARRLEDVRRLEGKLEELRSLLRGVEE